MVTAWRYSTHAELPAGEWDDSDDGQRDADEVEGGEQADEDVAGRDDEDGERETEADDNPGQR